MGEEQRRSKRLLVRLTPIEHDRLTEVAARRGHPMGRLLRDAFASQADPDHRLPAIATLVAVEQVRLFLERFFPDGEQDGRELRGPALDAALARLDELSSELGVRR